MGEERLVARFHHALGVVWSPVLEPLGFVFRHDTAMVGEEQGEAGPQRVATVLYEAAPATLEEAWPGTDFSDHGGCVDIWVTWNLGDRRVTTSEAYPFLPDEDPLRAPATDEDTLRVALARHRDHALELLRIRATDAASSG